MRAFCFGETMPNMKDFDNQDDWMKACVPRMMEEGKDNEQAVAACMGMWAEKTDAAKYRLMVSAVKAVGDWEIDITAVPFGGRDSDGQWFDDNTDTMSDNFSNPVILYHHGVMPGKQSLQANPVVIGKAMSVEKKSDGWHIRAMLDKTVEFARRVWEAAQKGLAVASSDSIAHLARLEVGGKLVMYEKNKPGRIAVWPLAGVSLWDNVAGNFSPASRNAIALPAMKAIYEQAGLILPDISENDEQGAGKAAKIAKKNLQKRARYLSTLWNDEE
jgi:hypothetical protein